jgi:carotenoid cleavage dioxygenase-like enzyme
MTTSGTAGRAPAGARAGHVAAPPEVAGNPYLEGVFAPVTAEVDVPALEVVGELPAELDGAYVRNGPNPRFSPIGSFVYPLDGDGMVHRVAIRDGVARYTNGFVRTATLRAEETAGRALWAGLTDAYRPDADTVGPALAGTVRELPDINVVRHGGKLLALAESAPPYRLDQDLRTLGAETFGGSQPAGITAHPKIDPRTGEMVVFCYHLGPPYLTWATIAADGTGTAPVPIDGVGRPVMIHDAALTEHYLVLVLAPLFFDPRAALRGGALLSWEPDSGTRIALVPRDGSPVRWCEDSAFWLWHTAGAYERDDPASGNPVVLDYVQWDAPAGLGGAGGAGHGRLARAVIDPGAGTLTRGVLAGERIEFPRIDDRRLTTRHRVIAAAGHTGRPHHHDDAPAPDTLHWFDPDAGTVESWGAEDLVVGEPAHAPDPGTTDPRSGWWLTFATDAPTGESWLLVIPAADPASGPQARIRMPVRVPLGLHGNWLPARHRPDAGLAIR